MKLRNAARTRTHSVVVHLDGDRFWGGNGWVPQYSKAIRFVNSETANTVAGFLGPEAATMTVVPTWEQRHASARIGR